jgi:hypothetical protein
MRILSTVSALSLLLAACSSTPAVIPTKNLEHPSDMTFVCVQEVPVTDSNGATTTQLSGQPMDRCHARNVFPDPAVILSGLRNLGTFAFIANPGRNELAVADMDQARLLDLTPEAPGYGMLPVGGDPEAIASSPDGCWVATANRTTCDFTLIDPAQLLAPTFSSGSSLAVPSTQNQEAVRRIAVQTGGSHSPLYASIGEIAFLPSSPAPHSSCGDDAAAKPRAVVTFPSCDMVALVDLSFADATATIFSAFYVRPGELVDAGSDPVCPVDCQPTADAVGLDAGTEAMDGAASDGGAGGGVGVDAGAGGQGAPSYLQPLALVPDGTRVYVASLLDSAVTSLDISAAGLTNPTRLNLAENPFGVTRLRLGIDPYRKVPLTNTDGTPVTNPDGTAVFVPSPFLENRGRFLYAVTRDDSIRVVEIAAPPGVSQTTPVECDANIVASAVANPAQGCVPIGSAPRRPLAKGPGIRIPTFANPDSPPPLPRDISFAELLPTSTDANYQSLSGQFGFVVASNGQVYVLNVAPQREDGNTPAPDGKSLLPATATHSFREARDVGKWAKTPLALSIAPQRQVITSDQAFPTTATFSALDGPMIRSFSSDNGSTTSWMDFPDPDTIISRSWSVIWEGALPYATRGSGLVQSAIDGVSAGQLSDTGADFCASGAQAGDVLMFSGCTQNSDCQPDDQFTCQVAVSGARGMCLPVSAAASATLINNCGQFMGSRMRYEIAEVKATSLSLRLKLDEVPTTTLNPCTPATEKALCRPDVDHGKLASDTPDGGVSKAFECVELHPQETAKDPRCVKRCFADSDCRAGHVCEPVPWTDPLVGKLCVEAPPIDSSCFPQPMTSYSVRAGHSFVVYGSSMPRISGTSASPGGTCQPQPPADPSLVARIPLAAPKCPDDFLAQAHPNIPATTAPGNVPVPAVPAVFVQTLAAQAGSNPCLYQGSHNDGDPPGGLDSGVPDNPHIRAFFQNPQIRFVLTNLDQYAGDLLAIHFELQYGYVPLTVQIPSYEVLLTMGTRMITGPTKTPESPIRANLANAFSYPYLYVVDQGRTALTPGSRGQVLRINPRAGSNEIATFDTTLSGSTPFQLQ